MAKELIKRKKGKFSSQSIPNPRDHEKLIAVTTLISEKTIDNKVGTSQI
jgi:hypothetical protein